jgi:hypothetical protein
VIARADLTVQAYASYSCTFGWPGVPGVMSDWTFALQIRRNQADTDVALTPALLVDDSTATVTMSLSAADTASLDGRYVYDLHAEQGTLAHRLVEGSLLVEPAVTRVP